LKETVCAAAANRRAVFVEDVAAWPIIVAAPDLDVLVAVGVGSSDRALPFRS
jgi:hypothetical protein